MWSVGCILAELLTMLPEVHTPTPPPPTAHHATRGPHPTPPSPPFPSPRYPRRPPCSRLSLLIARRPLPLPPLPTWRRVAWQANLPPQERNALFPGRSCFPLSPDEDEFSAPANLDQLNVIFSVIGTPSGRLSWIELPEMRDHLRGLSPVEPTALSDLLPGAPEGALDLLGLMLTFEPARSARPSPLTPHPSPLTREAARAPRYPPNPPLPLPHPLPVAHPLPPCVTQALLGR